jgi:putative FmdB family regulatory protein
MPTYEYACKSCGTHLEVVQSFSDDALTECPSCKGSLRKVFGAVGISFKGSGFYKNDSRSSKSSGKATSEKSDKPSTSEKSDKPSTSEKKTETAASGSTSSGPAPASSTSSATSNT